MVAHDLRPLRTVTLEEGALKGKVYLNTIVHCKKSVYLICVYHGLNLIVTLSNHCTSTMQCSFQFQCQLLKSESKPKYTEAQMHSFLPQKLALQPG